MEKVHQEAHKALVAAAVEETAIVSTEKRRSSSSSLRANAIIWGLFFRLSHKSIAQLSSSSKTQKLQFMFRHQNQDDQKKKEDLGLIAYS